MNQSPEQLARSLKQAVTIKEDNNTLPSLPVLAQEGFTQMGGVKQFMERVIKAYDAAKPGSQVQARIAEHFMDLITKLQDRGMLGDVGDVEALSETEVDAEIDRLILRTAKNLMPPKVKVLVDGREVIGELIL